MSDPGYDRLLELLVEKSFVYSDEPKFKLASGKMSSYYIDCKKVAYTPEGIELIGKAVFKAVIEMKPDAVGGLTLGADPLAVAAAAESQRRGDPFKAFVIRKEAKDHGTQLPIEGDIQKGEQVVILEDVTTSGASAMKAVNAARGFGLEVLAVVTLVDRAEGGSELIEKENLKLKAIFTKQQLFDLYKTVNEP